MINSLIRKVVFVYETSKYLCLKCYNMLKNCYHKSCEITFKINDDGSIN